MQWHAKHSGQVTECGQVVIALNQGDIQEQLYQFLRNNILLIEREGFYHAENDGVCEDGSVKHACSVGG